MLRILLTDDHPLIRLGLKQLLVAGFGKTIIGEASNAQEALDQVAKKDWDVLVMDITMPGRSGLDVLCDIKKMKPALPVLILSACSEEQFALRVLKLGASGYVKKESAPDDLVNAIKKVISGKRYITASVADKLAANLENDSEKAPHETLSNREYEVMCMIAKGKAPSQIAKSLSLSVKTVSTYRGRILEKLQFTSNAELTYYAIKNGLVE